MVSNFFDKKTSGRGIKNENNLNKELADELHKSIIIKFHKRKVQPPSIDNFWGVDLADMPLISKFNEGCIFLLCVIEKIYMSYSFKR